MLSIIISVRLTNKRSDIIERLQFCLSDTERPCDLFEFLVVDDGSSSYLAEQLKRECSKLNIVFLKTDSTPESPFNLAKARNYGARHASGSLLLFLDVDLIPFSGFFKKIINEAKLLNMFSYIDRFLMCPVIYLTNDGYEIYQKQPDELKESFSINALLSADNRIVEKFSSGTSAIVVNKHYYLTLGGQDETFSGWGFEDYEFTIRMMRDNPQFLIPQNWSSMAGNFMSILKYSGWKAAYRLHGDWLAAKGIYLIHAPHSIDKTYRKRVGRNEKLLRKQLNRGANTKHLAALIYPNTGVSLLFRTNPFCYSREFAPFLGDIILESEEKLSNAEKLTAFIRNNKITRVVFGNPYANGTLLFVYNWCRKNNFPLIICERGALPDSIYHDRSGFLSDSDSYTAKKWDKPLSKHQRVRTETYISSIRHGSHMLEVQAKRQELSAVRAKLGLKQGRKILLVPFQQPGDTTIRYFPGPIKSFANFHEVICNLPDQLGQDWHVVYKKHPVEDQLVPIAGAINADQVNIYDLLELADAVVVVNSGTGVLGMMFEKPVYILGDAFYAHDELNVTIKDCHSLASIIKSDFKIDREKMLRFIGFLRYEFYSFGIQKQRQTRYFDNKPITSTYQIEYYELRNWRNNEFVFKTFETPVSLDSPIYDRYKNYIGQFKSASLPLLDQTNRGSMIKRGKMKKLRERPVRFFVDAAKNLFLSKS